MINWITTAGFLTTATENVYFSTAIHASGTDTEYKIISGHLPDGLNFSSTGTISGTPGYVLDVKTSRFVVRAYNNTQVNDRTFAINVQGPNVPQWNTYGVTATFTISTSTSTLTASNTVTIIGTLSQISIEGYLLLGLNRSAYVINGQWVDYQLESVPEKAPTGTEITYTVVSGHLPPGLRLSKLGRISGFYHDNFISDNINFDTYIEYPKFYEFTVSSSDGVTVINKLFKVVGLHPDTFRTDNILRFNQSILDLSLLTANISYLQPPQFLNSNNLGTFRSNHNLDQPITAYDPRPGTGAVTYSLITGTTAQTNLPLGLELDPETGYIYGYLSYQPVYTSDYILTVAATKYDNASTSTIVILNTVTMTVRGLAANQLAWDTDSNLGTIETGIISELAVIAHYVDSNYPIKYKLVDGELPPGLTLVNNGNIQGQVEYGHTGTYTFTVSANDVYLFGTNSRNFTITVLETDNRRYTEIYYRPFLSLEKRKYYQTFTSNEFIFDSNLIYRYHDPNFGIQDNIKMVLEFGIEQVNLEQYIPALAENFYQRRIYFGDIKTAVAKDSKGTIIYEVVYVDAVDNMSGVSLSITSSGVTYHPASIENQRIRLQQLTLDTGSSIGINEYSLPLYMRTAQTGSYIPPLYMRVIPVCYALPGHGQTIANRIKSSGFDFKLLDFEVDRIVVQNSKDNTSAKYLIFPRLNISDVIDTDDDRLYGGDVLWGSWDNDPLEK